MNETALIEKIYSYVENNQIDQAVMSSLRLARQLKDRLYVAIFLRELYGTQKFFLRALLEDIKDINKNQQKFLWERSLKIWIETKTLDFEIDQTSDEPHVLCMTVGELDAQTKTLEQLIADLTVPSGMGEFDTAAFTDRYNSQKVTIRVQLRAIAIVKERIKANCYHYASQVENQIRNQNKTRGFLDDAQNEVNNFFKANSEDVYTKLQKASELIYSNNPEDSSLLLTQVRRAIKATADYFYPPIEGMVKCADGSERELGDDAYLNRLSEFVATRLAKSTSRSLLKAELDYLDAIVRKLNNVASKGVHSSTTSSEAKQGLLGLYLFLFNVCRYLQYDKQGAQ